MSREELLKSLRERQRIQTFPDMHKEPLWEKAADEIERLIVDRDEWKEIAHRDEWKEITHQSTTTTRRQTMSEPYIKTIIADIELAMRQLLDEVTRLTDDREDCPFCTPLHKQGDKQ